MPIAEIFLSAFITVLFEKLASADLLGFARQQGLHTQLHKWRQTLSQIKALLSDAEEKQFADTAVKEWLEELRDLAYDLDDILDKISTEASIRNLKAAKTDQAASTSKVNMRFMIPTCCTNFPTPRSFMFDRKMRSEIDEISTRLEEIFNLKSRLGLEGINVKAMITDQRVQLTSVVDESLVFGRDNDKGKILQMLLKEANPPEEVFSVIPIVGMGGVGKTTLAQLVYNDLQVNNSFDLKAWVCVSDEFDVLAITKIMHESVAPGSHASSDLNQLQVSLKEKLSKQRFLLVLDDVWNRNDGKWDLLCGPLRAGAPGSKIIVTTRDKRVASTMSLVPAYRLDVLEDNDCLSLLCQRALGTTNFHEHSNLKVIGEAIVRNCKGLPLAAKALGGLLRTDRSPKYWKEIMTSKIWDIPEGECDILPPLRLSYNHLPSRLKQLFAYCSIFPYDYVFDRDELVLLWMAEGFLQQSEGGKSMEELGCDCFKELLSRSFFQCSHESESRFVMHDRMNDLAQVVAGNLSFRLDSNLQSTTEHNKVSEKARRSSFIRQEYEVFKKFQAFHGVKGLRTFLPLPVRKPIWPVMFHLSNVVLTDLLPKLLCLRVLSLSGYAISEIPESIGDLKRLRYLNLSGTFIKSLPESVTELYNLQTLLLRGCLRLTKLPTGIGNLSNLRHLDCMGTEISQQFPAGIGKLTSLRTLSMIVLGTVGGLKVRELKSLSNIHGTLTMVGLDTIGNIEDATVANLSSKHGLDEVVMGWSHIFDDSRNESLEKEVFDILQPHRNLKMLEIMYYGGREFPRWVGDTSFSCLVQLKLRSCKNCTSLPSLGKLPLLKNLDISGMNGVKSVGAEFYGAGCPLTVAFPSLETLTFDGMPNWEEWSALTGVELLPCLSELRMSGCASLTTISISKLPSLRVLSLENCPEVVLRYLIGIASLTTLTIDEVSGLTGLQKESLHLLGALESFDIVGCSEMTSLWQEEGAWEDLINLRKLQVNSCEQLVSLAGDSGALPRNLESLSLWNCPNLEKLPSGLNTLKFLQDLFVCHCPKISCFPDGGLPPMLTKLLIQDCEALEVRRCNNEGMLMQSNCGVINSENDAEESNNHDQTKKISHLETLSIFDCSSLTSFPIGDLPSTLKTLSVSDCKKLETESVEKHLHNCMSSLESLAIDGWLNFKTLPECLFNFLHLTSLDIVSCPGLESFPEHGLPCNLRFLQICDCENLKLLPDQMQSLTSLESLVIVGCPRLNYFPQGGFPLNLKELKLGDIGVPISEWGLRRVSSLDSLKIWGKCPEVVCFPGECLLPISLTSLTIDGAVNLESLSIGVQDLPSLEKLSIRRCPKVQSLPNTLLSTLSCLYIIECPLLEPRCLKEGGDYWPLIAPIPNVLC